MRRNRPIVAGSSLGVPDVPGSMSVTSLAACRCTPAVYHVPGARALPARQVGANRSCGPSNTSIMGLVRTSLPYNLGLALQAALGLCACDSGAPPDEPIAAATSGKADTAPAPAECLVVDRASADFAPVQVIGGTLPPGVDQMPWVVPTSFTYHAPVSGSVGNRAGHEGVDYVHNGAGVPSVDVIAAARGTVAYVRIGCPQSSLFGVNTSTRECGSGWGDHVVVEHDGGIYTRYAHLQPGSTQVVVGDVVADGDVLAQMGNSGRSDVRHLHFELGTMEAGFDPCAGSQSFERIFRPTHLPFGAVPPACTSCIASNGGKSCAPRCPAGACRACVAGDGGQACLPRCGG